MDGVEVVRTDMCAFGMQSRDESGIGFVKKPTSMMTNSPEVARRLARRCTDKDAAEGDQNRHVQLINGRAGHAQVYPRSLYQAVCEGVAAQKKADAGNLVLLDVMSFAEMNDFGKDGLHDESLNVEAFDDVTNEPLNPKLVMAGRAEELAYFESMGVYAYATLDECRRQTVSGSDRHLVNRYQQSREHEARLSIHVGRQRV